MFWLLGFIRHRLAFRPQVFEEKVLTSSHRRVAVLVIRTEHCHSRRAEASHHSESFAHFAAVVALTATSAHSSVAGFKKLALPTVTRPYLIVTPNWPDSNSPRRWRPRWKTTGCPETSVRNHHSRCVVSQKSTGFICIPAEARNHVVRNCCIANVRCRYCNLANTQARFSFV